MYNTSAAFKTAMAHPSRELTARGTITFPDATTHALTPTEISKFIITENAGDHLPLGGVSASTLTLILDNRLGEWEPGGSILGSKSLDGAIVELEIGVNNSGYEYANAGVFVIEKPVSQEQDAIITLKGSDYLANRALTAFSDTLTYPQTVLQILQAACSQANIPLKTTVFVSSSVSIPKKPVWDENTTCRDVISYVACLAGGFARIDREGELEIISFANQAEGLYSQLLDSSFAIVDGELIWTYPAGYTGPAVTLVGSDLFIDEENIARLNDGELQFIGTFDGTNYYVHPNRYRKLSNQGVMFGAFNALSVYEHGAPNGYGATRIADDIDIVDNELNSIAVRGNPLLAYGGTSLTTLMMNTLASLGGLEYYAASIEWQGDPSITCGDMVTISNLKGEAYNVLITNQTLTFDNGFSMVSGNRLNTAVVGKAKVENLRVFTPTGKLNAAALEGDINIRAGRQLNLLSDGALVVKSGGDLNIESGGKINIASDDGIVLSSGKGLETTLGDYATLTVTDDKISTAVSTKADTSALENYSTITQTASEIALAVSTKLNANDPAAGVQTSKITIDSDSIDIASGGVLNLSAASQITIGTKQMDVGGTNLLRNTGGTGHTSWSPMGNHDISATALTDSFAFGATGPGNGGNAITTLVTGGIVNGQEYTISFDILQGGGGEIVHCELWGSQGAFNVQTTGVWQHITRQLTGSSVAQPLYLWLVNSGYVYIKNIKLEKGNIATAWSPSPDDPAKGVQTSHITIDSDSIDIASGGDINIASGADLNIESGGKINIASGADMTISAGGNFDLSAGTGKSGIGMSNNRSDDAFIWAGSDSPSTAPFSVIMSGKLNASEAYINGTLKAGGYNVWNKKMIQVSSSAPSSPSIGDIWIAPAPPPETPDADPPYSGNWTGSIGSNVYLNNGNGNTLSTALSGVASGSVSGTYTYSVDIQLKITHAYFSTLYVQVSAGAVSFPVQSFSGTAGFYRYTQTATSLTWIGNSASITLVINGGSSSSGMPNNAAGDIGVMSGNVITLTCSATN